MRTNWAKKGGGAKVSETGIIRYDENITVVCAVATTTKKGFNSTSHHFANKKGFTNFAKPL